MRRPLGANSRDQRLAAPGDQPRALRVARRAATARVGRQRLGPLRRSSVADDPVDSVADRTRRATEVGRRCRRSRSRRRRGSGCRAAHPAGGPRRDRRARPATASIGVPPSFHSTCPGRTVDAVDGVGVAKRDQDVAVGQWLDRVDVDDVVGLVEGRPPATRLERGRCGPASTTPRAADRQATPSEPRRRRRLRPRHRCRRWCRRRSEAGRRAASSCRHRSAAGRGSRSACRPPASVEPARCRSDRETRMRRRELVLKAKALQVSRPDDVPVDHLGVHRPPSTLCHQTGTPHALDDHRVRRDQDPVRRIHDVVVVMRLVPPGEARLAGNPVGRQRIE